MIIEIKDLPEGRKVSRILVDVTFEDTGVSQSVSQSFLDETNSRTKVTEEPVGIVSPVGPDVPTPAGPIAPALQVPVPPPSASISGGNVSTTNPSIPAEMLDMEF